MSEVEQRRFEALPGADTATQLRRWDDGAKVIGVVTKPLAHHRELLLDLVTR